MIDIQLLRSNLHAVAERLADRGFAFPVAEFEALESERKKVQMETQELQARRNQLSKQVGQAKAKGEDATLLMAQVSAQADQLKALEQRLTEVQRRLSEFLLVIPNVPHASVPAGKSSDDNTEARRVGAPRAFDIPWIVLDSAKAARVWQWSPATTRDAILEEIAQHAEKNPGWLDLSAPF